MLTDESGRSPLRAGDGIEALKVSMTSPDGRIIGRLGYGNRLELGFRDATAFGRYDTATEPARQLGVLLRGLRDLRRERVRELRTGHGPAGPVPDWDARRRYHAAVAKISATGVSEDGLIAVGTTGGDGHVVVVRPEALDRDGDEFAYQVLGAHYACHIDHKAQLCDLKREHFPR